jgi:G3E family GTPase
MNVAADRPIATTVIGGYLGAGKTTLLNRILREAAAGTAVLVNDFGSVGVDEHLVAGARDGVVALANGCICCSIADGFGQALERLRVVRPRPRRLVVEASGVSDPAQVATYGTLPGFRLDAVVVVADAEQIRQRAADRYVGDVVVEQLAAADLIVLNKCDLVDRASVDALRTWLATVAATAPVIEAVLGDVPLDVLLDHDGADRIERRPAEEAGSHDHGPADGPFETWTFDLGAPVEPAALAGLLGELPESIMRVKGLVRLTDPPVRRAVHRVGRRLSWDDVDQDAATSDRIVVIGLRGAIDPASWQPRFDALGRRT